MVSTTQGQNAFIEYAKVIAESKNIGLQYCPTFDNFYNGLTEEDQHALNSTISYIATSNLNAADLARTQDSDVEKFIALYIEHASENFKAEDQTQSSESTTPKPNAKMSKMVQKFCSQVGIKDPDLIAVLSSDEVRDCYKGKGASHMYLAFRSKLLSMWHETKDPKYLYFAMSRINAKTRKNLVDANYFGVAAYYEEAQNTSYF